MAGFRHNVIQLFWMAQSPRFVFSKFLALFCPRASLFLGHSNWVGCSLIHTVPTQKRGCLSQEPQKNPLLWLGRVWLDIHCELWPEGWRNGQIYTSQVSQQAGSIVTFLQSHVGSRQKLPPPLRGNWNQRRLPHMSIMAMLFCETAPLQM